MSPELPGPPANGSLIEARDLAKHFGGARRLLRGAPRPVLAVDSVSFSIGHGETIALVGESGSGKSTTGRLLIRLLEPTAGTVHFRGRNICDLKPDAMRPIRRRLQIIFQDPYSSLNPRMTVEEIVGDPLVIHGIGNRSERHQRVIAALRAVELGEEHAER